MPRRSGRSDAPKLSGREKFKKWIRLVIMLSVKKYGARIIGHLFFAYLLTTALDAMETIWDEFAEFKDCQDDYVESIATEVSREYNEAAEALAESVLERAKCVMGTLNIDLPGLPDIPLGRLPSGLFSKIFGWFTPGSIDLPEVELSIESNTEEVVQKVEKDLNIFRVAGKITRWAGIILAILAIFVILTKATYYTLTNKTWKPSKYSHIMRIVSLARVIGGYLVAMGVVLLQAYATGKFCEVSIDYAELKTPECSITDRDCEFDCEMITHKYPSPCTRCTIKLHWWWVEPFSKPNILGAAYLVFWVFVLFYECFEAAFQVRQMSRAKDLEREERRRKRKKYEEKKERERLRLLAEQNQSDKGPGGVGGESTGDWNKLDAPVEANSVYGTNPQGGKSVTKYADDICVYPAV